MKKNVKIILHHKINQNIATNKAFSISQFIKDFFINLINFLINFGYIVGLGLISIPKIPKIIASYFYHLKDLDLPKPKWQKVFSFVILVCVAIAPIFILQIASEGQKVGGRILGISDTILNDVNSAEQAIKEQDFSSAQNNFANVLKNLQTAESELNQSSIFLKSLINFAPASYNSGNALEAAQLLTEAAQIGSGLLNQIEQFNFSPEGLVVADGQNSKQTLLNLRNDIDKVDQKLSKANQLLKPLDAESLPAKYQSALKDSQELVDSLSNQMNSLSLATDLFTDILIGEKKFLVVLQNNNELRSTGGFIGTIAQGRLSDASIKQLDIRSVYDLDGQMQQWITPPYPMRAVNNKWYLRDANWLSDFEASAQRLSVMYEQEGGETPDIVIAITPDLFIDLLNLTGPITLPTYKVTVSSSNFIEQIQTTTSVAYDKQLNQPKQLLADLYPSLLQKISQDKGGVLGLVELLQTNLSKKNIMAYSRDPLIQERLNTFHWAGKVLNTQKDYLLINSSNLGGTKTDRALIRSAQIQTSIQPEGNIINQIRYTVENPLPNSPGLLNRSFVRFLVPEGSEMLAADGFNEISMPDLMKNQNYDGDQIIDDWNHNLKYDQSHKIYVGAESGKSFFGNWVEVAGGEKKTVTITYQLPFKLHTLDAYSLVWQKQSGMIGLGISQEISYSNKQILWDNLRSHGREVVKTDQTSLTWELDNLSEDQFVGILLNRTNK